MIIDLKYNEKKTIYWCLFLVREIERLNTLNSLFTLYNKTNIYEIRVERYTYYDQYRSSGRHYLLWILC